MRIVQARQEHVCPVIDLLSECNSDLRRSGIYQWDDVYPNLNAVAKDVADRTLYVALLEDRCIGAVSLSEEQDEAYLEVDWLGREPVLVIHRLCVAPAQQGRGVASCIYAIRRGVRRRERVRKHSFGCLYGNREGHQTL